MPRGVLTVAAILLALTAGVSQARVKMIRAGACEVLTDATGDVRLNDVPASQALADKHLDLTHVYLLSRGKTIDVTVYTEALNGRRRGTFLVTFTSGKTTYAAQASAAPWPSLPTGAKYSAGVAGRLVPVSGSVDLDNSTITISAPYSVFGAAGRKGTAWTRFAVSAEELLVDLPAPAPEPRLHDTATSTKTYRAGSRCRAPAPAAPRRRLTAAYGSGRHSPVDDHSVVDQTTAAASASMTNPAEPARMRQRDSRVIAGQRRHDPGHTPRQTGPQPTPRTRPATAEREDPTNGVHAT